MTSRWKRFYDKQMEDAKLRELVESELENLQLGVQIAKLRAAENLSQTKLAARAEMSAPKISAMENEPRNLTIGTLIRVAHALGSRVANGNDTLWRTDFPELLMIPILHHFAPKCTSGRSGGGGGSRERKCAAPGILACAVFL